MLVVSAIDSDSTTNCVLMHEWHCECITSCFGALSIMCNNLCLLTLCYCFMLLLFWMLIWVGRCSKTWSLMFFTCLCQIMEKGGVIYGFDILMCRNHLTYVVLVLLMFALLIILGDMMCYLCYFTKNTSYSCFSHTKIQMGRLLFLLDWMH